MKTGMTLQQMALEMERRKEARKDFVSPTTQLKMIVEDSDDQKKFEPRLKVNGHGTFKVKSTAHDQIAARVGIPRKYYDRMVTDAPALLADNVNHWFNKNPEQRMVRTLDGDVRAFLSNRYRRVDDADVAETAIAALLKNNAIIESASVTDTRMYIKARTERITAVVKKGDVVQAGIIVSNSEVGLGAIKIEPLIYRVVCTNGMIAADHSLRSRHVGRYVGEGDEASELYSTETIEADDRALLLKVRDVVRQTFSGEGFEKIVERMRMATENEIEGRIESAVEVVQKKFTLTDNETSGILKHLIKGGDLSQYGLVNAITRSSQDVKDYDRATDLERLGGVVLELPQRDWKEIALAKAA